jgi:hypothetical protein
MNTGSRSHIPEDVLERYALRRLAHADRVSLEEHLLFCSACQVTLKEIDEYTKVMKAAIAGLLTTPLSTQPLRLRQNAPASQILAVILIDQI